MVQLFDKEESTNVNCDGDATKTTTAEDMELFMKSQGIHDAKYLCTGWKGRLGG